MRIAPYILVGLALWLCVLKSGVHATLAGVVAALFIPARDPADPQHPPLMRLEHALHPWVAFAILPLFALATADVSLEGLGLADLLHPIPLGIIGSGGWSASSWACSDSRGSRSGWGSRACRTASTSGRSTAPR